jgi:hypothetical protein
MNRSAAAAPPASPGRELAECRAGRVKFKHQTYAIILRSHDRTQFFERAPAARL